MIQKTRTCTKCLVTKPVELFHWVNAKQARRRAICKPCHNEASLTYTRTRPEYVMGYERNVRMGGKFGLASGEYDALSDAQNHLCAICRRPETARRKHTTLSLAVDHDHATGRVRGLLCRNCNIGIGLFSDDPVKLRAAALYLEMAPT